jgi:hypothetical protein
MGDEPQREPAAVAPAEPAADVAAGGADQPAEAAAAPPADAELDHEGAMNERARLAFSRVICGFVLVRFLRLACTLDLRLTRGPGVLPLCGFVAPAPRLNVTHLHMQAS